MFDITNISHYLPPVSSLVVNYHEIVLMRNYSQNSEKGTFHSGINIFK